ncbi:hybrid sensor histidine kinase/response regulator [Planctomicrobium sp. SH661]|uniref:hybrid sensor histidine kinase/response regulator n=1 Tax=Planctomicrobium sp. SH661 TaxID=3448124 RepID=UPI003F5AE3D3
MHDPIFDIFRDEAREHLRLLEEGLLDLDATSDPAARTQLVNSLFRHAHNIKGDARALDLNDLQEAAGVLEELLEHFREDPAAVNANLVEKGLQELDVLKKAYEQWHRVFIAAESNDTFTPSTSSVTPAIPAASESSADASPLWMEHFLTVRVGSDRLDQMLNLVGEVRVLQRSDGEMQRQLSALRGRLSELTQQVRGELRPALESAFDHARRIELSLHQQQTREQVLMQSLEENISAARLLPVSMLADSLRRPVRDLARSLGKEVRYQADVGDVLLDKAVLESLRGPLLHLVRNAVDHGIETPQVRRSRGKNAQGTIHLQAGRRGEKVYIQISDDGAGADFDRIRKRILDHDLLSQQEVDELSPEQLSQWLFQPGFSTADVGEISGRGVGLDVVRDALQRIQGRIELSTESGKGTTFSLFLPVTLSTIRILTVWCGGQCFGIPSNSILRTGRVQTSELRRIKETPVILIENEPVRWIPMAEFLQVDPTRGGMQNQVQSYVVIQQEGRKIALQVDDLDDEREVLLKPLGFPLSGTPGILGGTIRPDGSVQLVLDLNFDQSHRETRRWQPQGHEGRSHPEFRVLVVDDSPTTRALLRNIFTGAGYEVQTAVDGIDALEKLRIARPDLVVCDFEMPRLNGVDLTRQIKSNWNLPVILVTGREQEHHRREGLEAGADAYVVKSTFRGESLLDLVKQFLAD